jgi:hypothetical protein
VLPAGSAPVNPVTVHDDLRAGLPLRSLESPSHAVRVQRLPAHRFVVDLQEGAAPADADFVLEWRPEAGREPRAAVYTQERDGERFVLLMVLPPAGEATDLTRIPREAIFVVDTSGSMQGESLEQAKRALTSALGRLQPDDRFNVVQFNSVVTPLFPTSVPAAPEAVEQARRWVGDLVADGGTEMLAALRQVLLPAGDWEGLRQVVFITDGQVGNEPELFQYIVEHLGESRLFTVGIGAAPNAHFMRKAAEFGRGTSTAIESVERVEKGMGDLLAALESPVIRDLQVRWDDPTAETWPKRLPDLYLGAPLILAARLTGTGEGVAVSGARGDLARVPWEVALSLAGAIPGEGIDKLWARQKVESLIDSQVRGADDEQVRRAVTRLGLRHGLLTPYTSLVAVDVTPSAAPGEPSERHALPLNQPRGGVDASGGVVSESILVFGSIGWMETASSACTFEDREMDELPGWPDPWAVLRRAPGVLTGLQSPLDARPPFFTAAGAPADQSIVMVDSLEIADAASLDLYSVDPGLIPVEQAEVIIGGADFAAAVPGARLNLLTERGTNELRGSAYSLWAREGERGGSVGDELRRHETSGLDLGGPLRVDELWLWGFWGRQEVRAVAPGGPGEANRVTGSWTRGDATEDGRGAGMDRAPEATWDHDGRMEVLRLEDSHVFSPNLFAVGSYGEVDRHARDLPTGSGMDAAIDPAGMARGSWPAWKADAQARDASLEGVFYAQRFGSHELRSGARWRDEDERTALEGQDAAVLAGEVFGLPRGTAVAQLLETRESAVGSGLRSLWAQDLWRREGLTLGLGLRYDDQRLGGFGVQAGTLSPRFEVLWTPETFEKTQLQGAWGRFTSRLGPGVAGVARLRPGSPAAVYSLFADADGDLVLDGGEAGSLRPWFSGGADLSVDPGLRPEITDEVILGVRRELWHSGWAPPTGAAAPSSRAACWCATARPARCSPPPPATGCPAAPSPVRCRTARPTKRPGSTCGPASRPPAGRSSPTATGGRRSWV